MVWSWSVDDYDIDSDDMQEDLQNVIRTNGDMPCEMCHQPLYRHYKPFAVTVGTLVVDCYRNFWKL
jgi:hypothetical protein